MMLLDQVYVLAPVAKNKTDSPSHTSTLPLGIITVGLFLTKTEPADEEIEQPVERFVTIQ
jgi:hypothetical protein